MKKWVFGLFVLAGCGGGDPCEDLCERADSLGCENQPSLSECIDSCVAPESCEKEYDDFMSCLAKKTTVSDMSCEEDTQEVAFPEGVCEAEAAAMLVCALSDLDME